MAFARAIAIFTITVSLLTFVAFFGRLPAFRNTPIGFLHRLLVLHIPSALRNLDIKLTNGRITNGGARLGHYLMNDKHPVVMIFFLGLVTISAGLFVPTVWHLLPTRHKLLIPLVVPLPYLFTYLCARRNNETMIHELNHAAQMRHYPYDRILFFPGQCCSTCKFLKPARSKHCSICKSCVSRMDHHCVWVNNCLGRGNYKWFLALLFFTGVMIAYGAYLAYIALTPMVEFNYKKYEGWYRYKPSPDADPTSWGMYLDMKLHYFLTYLTIYIEEGGISAAGVGLLALLTWPLPLGLLAYQLYLVYAGMTTNESAKWSDWRDDIADGVVFLGQRKEETFRDYLPRQSNLNGSARSSSSRSAFPTLPETPPEDEEPPTTWPLESKHILIRTTNGQPPNNLPPRIKSVADKESFVRVWDLGAVQNVYDLGFWDNLLNILKN
ncbi:palmitoyltransferase swf1 [Lentithecium fluviatile CBS 122367]|uniref:Palmitoyltransferase n=1 Tax=Lentithecium fluviatile CBS 122367 TaxID=1168545 RepID=A0A6G1ISP1_9PLEO|nr:palmitoyltransferase swf1 [Lentithecium fluviatile CBS 122367]